tara:strand:- start:377 stop:730 length:354 start_codon:yes stop_codon:yes gene_type:complete
MGDLVDLDAFRKKRETEEREKAEAEAKAQEEQDQAEIEYMQDLLHRIMTNLSDVFTGSMIQYTTLDQYPTDSWSSDDYTFNTYYHEAGYDEDGYYEKSWEVDPFEEYLRDREDDEDF